MEPDNTPLPTVDELRADLAARRAGIPDPNSDHPVDQVRAERTKEAQR